MRRKHWIVAGGVLAALLVATVVGASAVYADTNTPPAPPDDRGAPLDGQRRLRPLGPEALEAAAKVLGMTMDELQTQLQAGTTLEDIAADKGVAFEDVQTEIQAAHKATMLENIKQAVADGKMTQDKADWLIIGIEKGYLDGPGFGFGPGMGPGGRGPGGPPPEDAPAQQ